MITYCESLLLISGLLTAWLDLLSTGTLLLLLLLLLRLLALRLLLLRGWGLRCSDGATNSLLNRLLLLLLTREVVLILTSHGVHSATISQEHTTLDGRASSRLHYILFSLAHLGVDPNVASFLHSRLIVVTNGAWGHVLINWLHHHDRLIANWNSSEKLGRTPGRWPTLGVFMLLVARCTSVVLLSHLFGWFCKNLLIFLLD